MDLNEDGGGRSLGSSAGGLKVGKGSPWSTQRMDSGAESGDTDWARRFCLDQSKEVTISTVNHTVYYA